MADERVKPTWMAYNTFAPSFPIAGGLKVSISGTSAQSAALDGNIVLVRPDTDCWVAWGTNPTATTTDGVANVWCPSGEWTELHIADGDKVAAITSSANGLLYIRYGKTLGQPN